MRMRRAVPLILALAALAACGEAPPPQAAPSPPAGAEPAEAHVVAGFPPHGIADTISLQATYRLPLRDAALVAPDGTATPATYIHNDAAPSNETGQWAVQSWQNPVTGNDAFAALAGNSEATAAMHAEAQLLAVVSLADIPLPDPVAYRRDWRHYRIRLVFGTPPGGLEREEIPAPAPLPAAQPE